MSRSRIEICVVLLLVLLASFSSELFASKFPKPVGYVNDFANMISPNAEAAIEQIAMEVKTKTGTEIVVATIMTCGGVEIEQYAVDLFMEWGIGERGKDNGILVLVALEDRKIFIKTGYGVEGVLPDAEAHRIYTEIIVPGFRAGKYDEALVIAVSSIAKLVLAEVGENLSASDSALVRGYTEKWAERDQDIDPRAKLILVIVVGSILILIVAVATNVGRRGYRGVGMGGGFWFGGMGSGGGFGGGFGGFGGGSCGGGGAGGGW
ncbi:MAG: TPM domain-containing protein [bacterium]